MIVAAALFLLLVAIMPQWVTLPGEFKTFHLAGLALIGAVATSPRCLVRAPSVLRANLVVILGFAGFMVLALALTTVHDFPYYNSYDLRRLLFLTAIALATAVAFAALERRPLAWLCLVIGLILPTLFAVLMVLSALSQGLSPAKLQALFVSSPLNFVKVVFNTLFQSSLAGEVGEGAEEALANWRHGIMNSLMLSMTLMLAFPHEPGSGRRLLGLVKLAAALLASAIIIVSFSRSVTIELLLALLVYGGLVTAVRGLNPTSIILGCGGVLALAVIATSDLGQALMVRFTEETGSYDIREQSVQDSLDGFARGFWYGTEWQPLLTGERSAHNMVLNAARGTGVVGLVLMAAFVLAFVIGGARIAWSCIARASFAYGGADGRWVIAIAIIPAVRSVTAGGGLAIAEWVALGAFMGFRARAALAQTRDAPAAAVSARGATPPRRRPLAARWTERQGAAIAAGARLPALPG